MILTQQGSQRIANNTIGIANKIVLLGTDTTDENIPYLDATDINDLSNYNVITLNVTSSYVDSNNILNFRGTIPSTFTSSKIIRMTALCYNNEILGFADIGDFVKNNDKDIIVIFSVEYRTLRSDKFYKMLL